MLPTRVAVDEYTTPDPVTANEDMSIDELRRLMETHGIRHLPIVRGRTVVGVISNRDIRLVSGLTSAERMQIRAADIMAATPMTVSASTPLDEVAFAMSERKVGSVIVNDEDGEFLGIFTATDALNALIEIIRGGGIPVSWEDANRDTGEIAEGKAR
ncbi:MAG TPA: CBS domain-containing protein [Thiobacillaceae bacterium]|nr:CBS domain-containing protein [Thiobacillaceae bacterium]HNU63538.1 CBS domain-containing protein [Thiobacillaceae bacterium]